MILIDDDLIEKDLDIDFVPGDWLSIRLEVMKHFGSNWDFIPDKTLFGGYFRQNKTLKCIVLM